MAMKRFENRLDGAYQVHCCQDSAAMAGRHRKVLKKKRREPRTDKRQMLAYVNWGRWVIDCLCGAGNAVDTTTATAHCFGCGTVHERVVLPDEAEAIEDALIVRHRRNRHWRPGETVADLVAENVEHEVR